jgi:hypothetical protein
MTRKIGLTAVALALALCCAAPPALAGDVTLATKSEPKDAQDFTYTVAGAQVVRLDDDTGAAGADNALAFMTKLVVADGVVEIVESPVVPGWTLTRINCDSANMPRPQVNLAQRKVAVATPAWCTFVHQKVAP